MKAEKLEINLTVMGEAAEDFEIDSFIVLKNIRDKSVDTIELRNKLEKAVIDVLAQYGDVEVRE